MDGITNGKPGALERDPLGKSALFSAPAARPAPVRSGASQAGKRALYSVPPPAGMELTLGRFTVEVNCSACRERSRVDMVEFTLLHVPFFFWVPWLRYSRYITCPACDRRAWIGVDWTGVGVPA